MSNDLANDLASLRIDRAAPKRSGNGLKAVLVVALLGAGGWAAVTYGRPAIEAQFFKLEVVTTEVASISPIQASVDLTSTGYLIPQSTAKVGAKIVGRIVTSSLNEGDTVKAGEVLFELDPDDQKAAVQAAQALVAAAGARILTAKAQVAEVELEYKRQKQLAEVGAVPTAGVDDLAARKKSLEAQVKAAEAEVYAAQAEVTSLSTGLKNLKIVAPIDGTVLTKPASLGDVASPGVPLVELANFDSLLIEVDVPESRLGMIKAGGPCEVALDAFPSTRFPGTVKDIAPRINRAKATGVVKVSIDKPPAQLRPEMSARVSFLAEPIDEALLKEPPKIVVPGAAVIERNGQKAVWVVVDEKARLVPVTLGEAFGAGFILKSGPSPGAKLVKDPPPELSEGRPLKEKSAS